MEIDYKADVKPKNYADGVPVFCAHDEIVPIEKLVMNPNNPNEHPDNQIEILSKIIASTGWRMPITVSTRSGFIVKGHGRYLAALKAGMKEVPVDYQQYSNEAEEYADLVADNRIQEFSELNDEMLSSILKSIDESDVPVELAGYTKKESDELQAAVNDSLKDMENMNGIEEGGSGEDNSDRIFSESQDIWLLGRHRLMVGDSTSSDDVKKLIDGKEMDLAVTDPPYGIAYQGRTEEKMTIENDDLDEQEFIEFLTKAFENLSNALRAGGGTIFGSHQKAILNLKQR